MGFGPRTIESGLRDAFACAGDPWDSMVCTASAQEMAAPWSGDYLVDPFTAWGARYVYFPLHYDGRYSQWIGFARRNPCDEAAHPQGHDGYAPTCYFCPERDCTHDQCPPSPATRGSV